MSLTISCLELTSRLLDSGFCQFEIVSSVGNSLTGSSVTCEVDISSPKGNHSQMQSGFGTKKFEYFIIT